MLKDHMKLTSTMRSIKEATTLRTIPSNPKMLKMTDNDGMDMENTIAEYNSNDVFGDIK
jgi:hypothetical protein